MNQKNINDKYTIRRIDLLGRLRINREAHRKIFEQALVGYRKAVIEVLDKSISDAKAGKRISLFFNLVEPQDHTSEYDAVIDLFEMVQGDIVEISYGDFLRFVRDTWDWSNQFTASTSFYTQK